MKDEIIQILKKVLRRPLGVISVIIVLMLILVALFASLIAPYPPNQINISERLVPPSLSHFFGTDMVGRDIFSRVIIGSRISLRIGTFTVLSALLIGGIIGLFAGYLGGIFDDLLMRVTDAFMAFPYLVLSMAFVAILGPSLNNALIAIIVIWWPRYARLARGGVLAVRNKEYIQAAEVVGSSTLRIVFHHILPNISSPLMIQGTLDFGEILLVAATLSFIGLGAQPPTPEWGAMINAGKNWLREAWWCPTFPGIAIFFTALGFNLLGDTLRDVLDPKLR